MEEENAKFSSKKLQNLSKQILNKLFFIAFKIIEDYK